MKFDVIYADPAWPYNTWVGDNVPNRRKRGRGMAESVYQKGVMTLEDIRALPVEAVAAKSAALVMWITGPRIFEAPAVAAAWGFPHFSTILFSWFKTNKDVMLRYPDLLEQKDFRPGIGYWTQSNVELALLFLRGPQSKRPKRQLKGVKQVVVAPIGEHSEKPVEVYKRITDLFGPERRYLELFGRRLWPNFTVLGDEVEAGQDIKVSLDRLAALADDAAPPKTSLDLTPAAAVEDWQTNLRPFGDGMTGQLKFTL